MESKDMASYESYSMLQTRAKRTPLHIEPPASFIRKSNNIGSDSAISSPCSASTAQSPATPFVGEPSSASTTSDPNDLENDKDPASGPHRTRATSESSPKGDKEKEREKRKRSRVTPDQLNHLERFFAVDRSPTAARRREISELLGMQERQTQIWFQNRRAKAKHQDGKQKGRSGSVETPPDTPPELSTGFEVDLHNLIHEDEPVTIIPCTDLSIGTWRRIATTVGKHDLVAYVCDAKRCLTWFIHSAGYGFKMEIPFDTILETEFTNAAPGSGLACFIISQPPVFFLENISSPRSDGSVVRHWKRCADWTEGQQASKVLRHDLIGSAVQLAHLLRNFEASSCSDIALHSPIYSARVAEPPLTPLTPISPMELPEPPMAGLRRQGFCFRDEALERGDSIPLVHTRHRSMSGPASLKHREESDLQGDSTVSRPISSAAYLSPPFSHALGRMIQPTEPYSSSTLTEYHESDDSHSILGNYSSVAISRSMAPRSFSAQPVDRTFYCQEPCLVSPYHGDNLRRHSSTSALSQQYHSTPSPPLLTQPFRPSDRSQPSPLIRPIVSGLPGVVYDSDGGLYPGEEGS